jgi:hypothetical protein
MGVSDVTAESADAVDGKADANERTVARTASGSSWVGTAAGGGGWKSEGWDLSVEGVLACSKGAIA